MMRGSRRQFGPSVAAAVGQQDDGVRLVEAARARVRITSAALVSRVAQSRVSTDRGRSSGQRPEPALGTRDDALGRPEVAGRLAGDTGDCGAGPPQLRPDHAGVSVPNPPAEDGTSCGPPRGGQRRGAVGPGRVRPPPRDRRRRTSPSRPPGPARPGRHRSTRRGRRRRSGRPCADRPRAVRSAPLQRRRPGTGARRAPRPGAPRPGASRYRAAVRDQRPWPRARSHA